MRLVKTSLFINDKIVSNECHVTDENGTIVITRNVGDNYFIGVCHDTDSYYTEILNSTSNNTKFSVNVNNQTSNNRRVNITAKSNIPNEVLKGKLLFILPNSTQINANYTSNGTWWAVHEFDDAGNYTVNATYEGLEGVIINNATISIIYDASVDVNNKTLDLLVDDTFNLNATTNPINLPVNFTSSNSSVVTVDKNGKIVALSEGNATIIVSIGGDGRYAENSTTVTVTVSKVPTSISIENDNINLEVSDEIATGATLYPTDAGNLTYDLSNDGIVKIEDSKIIALKEGNVTITVSFKGNNKYLAAENKTINVTVTLKDASISVNNNTLDLFVDDTFTIVANTTPKGLNVTYKPDNSGIISVDENGLVTALKEGTTSIMVKVGGDGVYAENTTTVTVTVKKVNATMNISADEITEGENATINIELPIDATGNVTTTVNGKTYSSKVENGKTTITIPDLEYGNYTLPVTYSGDDKYNPLTKNVDLTVKEDKIIVSAPDLTKYYSGSEKFVVNVSHANGRAIAGKEVKITINGVTYKRTTDENGSASLSINLNTGTYDVGVEVDNVTVKSIVTILPTIKASDIESKTKNLIFTANFLDGEGNYLTKGTNVSFNINGVIYDSYVNDDKGSVRLDLTLDKGKYIITSYNPVSGESASNNIAVDLKNVDMILSGDEITAGENATISVTLPDDTTGNVTATINGKTYTSQVNNGKADIIISDLTSGNYSVPVTYSGDDKYNPAAGEVNITVNENATVIISAENLTKYYKDSKKFTVTVTDAEGQPAPNKTVEITINGVTYKRTTDKNGTASLNINLNSGEYPATVVVDGVEAKYTVTVKPTIDASDIIKIFRNGTQYNAIFTDSNANPLPNIKVSFNIQGIIYNRTTDRNGAAKLDINLDAGDYIITAFNSATGEMKSNSIKVISLIESDDLTKYYRNASQFVVRIHTSDGAYVGAGEEAKFNINGVIYTRTTNATGHAKLNINLGQGNYTITTYYKDCSRGNTIEVIPILTADDLSMKYMDGSQFKAKLVDGEGKAYPNKSVTFNINGVFYNRTTDNDGVAKLNIRLMVGQYIITSSYNGCNIANKITISA